jgi:transcriptional regulator with XRE-family HTH domain
MDAKSVGPTVRWARKRAGMTQQQLAHAVGMPQPSIARIERGTVMPRTATLIQLLAATGHRLTVESIGAAVDREAIRRRLAMNLPQRTREALGRAAKTPETNPIRILRRLRRFGVPFVLIGELAEVAHGAPARVPGLIEVCHASTDVARERLAQALDDLGARPSDGSEHITDVGRVRLLTEVATGDQYDELVRTAANMNVDAGILVRVAALEDLIRIRRALSTPEDREAVEVLNAVREEATG